MQDSGPFNRGKLEKSLDMINSSVAICKSNTPQVMPLIQLTEDDRLKIERVGIQASAIGQIDSESDMYE